MMISQETCLLLMLVIGMISTLGFQWWPDWTKVQRRLSILWIVFWLGPPLYFVWTKGVLG
jgi:hypothetical protein